MNSNILRVGQIAGPVEDGTREGGEWNRNEWFPSVSLLAVYWILFGLGTDSPTANFELKIPSMPAE